MNSKSRLAKERRQHKRYTVRSVSGVLGKGELAKIVNISMGGLTFLYAHDERDAHAPISLGILFGPDGYYLDKLTYKTVSDHLVSDPAAHEAPIIRQRHLKFLELTPEQEVHLVRFIQKHATEKKPSRFESTVSAT